MTDDTSRRRDGYGRREILAATATLASVGIAGCSGGSGDGDASTDSAGPTTGNGQTPGDGAGEPTTSAGADPSVDAEAAGSFPYWVANPSRNGYAAEYDGPGPGGSVVWKHPEQYQGGSSTALVAGGATYLTDGGSVRALGSDGNGQWTESLSIETPSGSGGPVTFRMADTLVVTGGSRVLGLSPADGSREWDRSLPGDYERYRPVGAQGGEVVYLADVESGGPLRVLWYDPVEDAVVAESDEVGSRVYDNGRPVVGDGTVFLDGAVVAVSRSDGSILWDATDAAYERPRLYSNGVVLLATAAAGGVSEALRAVDATNGETLWTDSQPAGKWTHALAADGDRVYTRREKRVVAYGLDDGTKSWERSTDVTIGSAFAVGGSNLYFATNDGTIRVLDTASGEEKGRCTVGTTPVSLAVVGDRLYCNHSFSGPAAGTKAGQLFAVTPE